MMFHWQIAGAEPLHWDSASQDYETKLVAARMADMPG
jgi:hypothetical protein